MTKINRVPRYTIKFCRLIDHHQKIEALEMSKINKTEVETSTKKEKKIFAYRQWKIGIL